eukprot:TRINITY_DN16908_c0_g1_i1.p1 TRINITY_DN16908_c0_g1~~TRINITY_DN16908_c0_g1_i1.p1  ORF type:complete len:158 (-),score=29.70 TRINITY_DN16908_c0_g1_i1:712-1185(-)
MHVDLPRPELKKLVDKVFYDMADIDRDQPGVEIEKTMNFAELYIAILLVYNEMNKLLTTHMDPPKRGEVNKLLQEFDTNKDGVLNRDEFEHLMHHFVQYEGKRTLVKLFAGLLITPALVFGSKYVMRQVPAVGPVYDRIPRAVLMAVFSCAVGLAMK